MHKREDLDCKSYDETFKYLEIFLFGIESLWTRTIPVSWDFIDGDNLNALTLKVKGFDIIIRLRNSTPR